MNNDIISRQAAIAHAISGRTREFEGEKWIRVSEVRESLKTMPSAERRGRWLKGDKMADYPRVPYKPWETYCSCCGGIKEQNNDNFCGNCGASMRG